MKYWIQVFQLSGVVMFAGAVITSPASVGGALWGLWLVLFGYLIHLITKVEI